MIKARCRIYLTILIGAFFVAACSHASRKSAGSRQVTIYVSTDRVFSEPVLRGYEQKSAVKVNVVYDTEETKSTGLANRLLAEKENPRADVFWSNEPVRTLVLKRHGALAPYKSPNASGIPSYFKDMEGYWTGFSARLRVIVYNTNLVKSSDSPRSVFDLVNPKWKDQTAIADPRFGTTSFHVAAIYVELGDARADEFFGRFRANGVKIVPANSVVCDMVARGEVKFGLTDTDDANVAISGKKPVAMVLPDRDGMGVPVMPNMVSLIAGAPNPEAGKKLIDYLLSPESERLLAQSEAVQIPLHDNIEGPENLLPLSAFKPMTLNYGKAAGRVEDVLRRLQSILGI
jgi:iron(III) transport system substrate-binding protein